jgi:hypothetical protein
MMAPPLRSRFQPPGEVTAWGYFTAGPILSPPVAAVNKYVASRHSSWTHTDRMLAHLASEDAVMLALPKMCRSPFMGPPITGAVADWDLTLVTDGGPPEKIEVVFFKGTHIDMIDRLRKDHASMGRMHGFSANQSAQP